MRKINVTKKAIALTKNYRYIIANITTSNHTTSQQIFTPLQFSGNSEFLLKILQAYCTFISMLNYNILFNHLRLRQSYVMFSTATRCIFTFHRDWLTVNCINFITKDQWPPNSPHLNLLDYHAWGAILQVFYKHHPKPKTIPEQKCAGCYWNGTSLHNYSVL